MSLTLAPGEFLGRDLSQMVAPRLFDRDEPGLLPCPLHVFLCELGPRDYAITDANGDELSERWAEALLPRQWAMTELDAAKGSR